MFRAPEISYFSICGFPIYYYGIILAVAVFLGLWISDKIATKEYNLFGIIPRIATPVIIGGIVGARLYYCLLNIDIYIKNPFEILYIREGGLSIHGAIIGGIIVIYFMAKKYHIRLLKLCDIFALGMPLAQALDGETSLIRRLSERLTTYHGSYIFSLPIVPINIFHTNIFILLFFMNQF